MESSLPQRYIDPTITSVPLLDVGRGNSELKSEIMDSLSEIIDSGRFIGGAHCKALEESVADVAGTEFAIGCASGSDALLLALMAVNIGPGDEVICPSFTFFATASAVSRLGATPIFVDVDHKTFNMNPELIEPLITKKTKAIIPVHLFGQCCDMDPIMEIAKRHGLKVIEDAAQSIGATYKGQPAGSIGDIGCFSFYPTKNLGGFGDGGMLTTGDGQIADDLRLLTNHGMRPRYHHQEIGINSRLDSMQAAILQIKIQKLAAWSKGRIENARRYNDLFREFEMDGDVLLPTQQFESSQHVWNQYTIRVPNGWRDNVRQQMADMNVGTEIYYPIPVHLQVCFNHLTIERGSLPETELASSEVLSLPIFPELREAEQRYVVGCLSKALQTQAVELRPA